MLWLNECMEVSLQIGSSYTYIIYLPHSRIECLFVRVNTRTIVSKNTSKYFFFNVILHTCHIQYGEEMIWYFIDFQKCSTWHLYLLEINLASLFLLFGERAEKWECAQRWMEKLYKLHKNNTIFIRTNCHREAAPSCPQLSTAAKVLFYSVKITI